MKRITLLLVVVVALTASALAQVGGRFAPKGTFTGEPSVLRSIANGRPAIQACYTAKLGAGWDQPGALEIQGQPTQIPVGAMVPGNMMLMRDGSVRPCLTVEGRTDKRGDTGYYVFNKKSGRGHWFKSCGQPFDTSPPPKPEKPVFETDFENKIDIDLSFNFELRATATSNSEATAIGRGGNAVVYNLPPQMYIPRRQLAQSGTEMYQVASLGWVAVPKMTQNNNQSQQQQQQQQQWQEQWQEQMQEMQQQIELWIKNHGG